MEISATLVKELREKTGVGMMQCKAALKEANGDMKTAIEFLRKQGEETAVKRHGKAAKEGKIEIRITDNVACIVEVNSETDFVARNADFLTFVENLSDLLIKDSSENLEALYNKKLATGLTVKDALNEILAKIGENIAIRRFNRISYDKKTSRIFSYIHAGGKIGVLLQLSSDNPSVLENVEIQNLGKDLTLQIAASNPLVVKRDQLASDIIEKEKEIYRSQALNEKKPEKIIDKIVEGKMVKYFQDVCLLEQPYIRDTEKTIQDVIIQTEKNISSKININLFIRYLLGGETS